MGTSPGGKHCVPGTLSVGCYGQTASLREQSLDAPGTGTCILAGLKTENPGLEKHRRGPPE